MTLEDPSGNPLSEGGVLNTLTAPLPTTGTYKLIFNSQGTTALAALDLSTFQDPHGTITVHGPSVTANISANGAQIG